MSGNTLPARKLRGRPKQYSDEDGASNLHNLTSSNFKSWCSEPMCDRRSLYVLNQSGDLLGANRTLHFCGLHRPDGAIPNLRPSQRCRFVGGADGASPCVRWSSYGDAARRVPLFCRQHAPAGLVNVKARMCTAGAGCVVQASFGDPLDGKVPIPAARAARSAAQASARCRRRRRRRALAAAGKGRVAAPQIIFCAAHAAPHHRDLRRYAPRIRASRHGPACDTCAP